MIPMISIERVKAIGSLYYLIDTARGYLFTNNYGDNFGLRTLGHASVKY